MVRCASLFSQMVALFNRLQFYHLVVEHRAERYSKGHSSGDHFVAMFFANSPTPKACETSVGALSLDSTTISLCLSLFPWAESRRTNGAVKLQFLLDQDGYFPT